MARCFRVMYLRDLIEEMGLESSGVHIVPHARLYSRRVSGETPNRLVNV
jgi:hypothetical protein